MEWAQKAARFGQCTGMATRDGHNHEVHILSQHMRQIRCVLQVIDLAEGAILRQTVALRNVQHHNSPGNIRAAVHFMGTHFTCDDCVDLGSG